MDQNSGPIGDKSIPLSGDHLHPIALRFKPHDPRGLLDLGPSGLSPFTEPAIVVAARHGEGFAQCHLDSSISGLNPGLLDSAFDHLIRWISEVEEFPRLDPTTARLLPTDLTPLEQEDLITGLGNLKCELAAGRTSTHNHRIPDPAQT